ncbi:hypothetical protein Tco_1514309 [Tanacetum coccineum]
MERNIFSQDTTNLWDQVLGEVHMSNNTFATQASCPCGNNAEGSGSTSRQAQQTEPAVGQDGSSRSGAGVVIGFPVAAMKVVQVFQVVQVLPVKVHPILDGQ